MAGQNAQPERVSLAAMMRKRTGQQTPEELEAEKANRGTLAQMMDKVVASRGFQQQAKARR